MEKIIRFSAKGTTKDIRFSEEFIESPPNIPIEVLSDRKIKLK